MPVGPLRGPPYQLVGSLETRPAEDVRKSGYPAAPVHPDDLQECDLAAMGGKLLGVINVNDAWVEFQTEAQDYHRVEGTNRLGEKNKLKSGGGSSTESITPGSPPVSGGCPLHETGIRNQVRDLRPSSIRLYRRRANNKAVASGDGIFTGVDRGNINGLCGKAILTARRGTSFATDEYVSTEIRIDQLSFERIDSGV